MGATTVSRVLSQVRLLRQRDFGLFWLGWSVSQVGSQVTIVALPLVAVLALDASAFQVGLLTAAGYAAWLLVALPAGVLVDRIPRRPVLVAADAGRAVLVGSVPAAAAMGWLTLVQLYAVALLTGVLTVFFDVAEPAYLPALVDRGDYVGANGLLQASRSVAMMGGPGLGGLLVRVAGAPFALVADAVSYVLSAALLAGIRTREKVRERADDPVLRDLAEGMRAAYGDSLLRALTVAAALANLTFAASEALVVVFLAREVGLPPQQIGLLLTAGGAGGVIGGLVAGGTARRVGAGRTMLLAVVVMVPARLLIPLTGTGAGVAYFVAGILLTGVGVVVFNVTMASFIQAAAPAHLLGRVTASLRFVSRGMLPLGGVLGGTLGSWLGLRPALWTLAVVWCLVPLWLLQSPLRRMPDLPRLG